MFKKFLSFVLLAAILVLAFPLSSFAELENSEKEKVEAVTSEILSMIKKEHVENQIVVTMQDGITPKEAENLFQNLGILTSLTDQEICLRRNYDYFPTTQISFTLYVPEQQIVDRLVQLQLSEIVYRAIPNLIIKTEGVEEISSGNDIPPHFYKPQ